MTLTRRFNAPMSILRRALFRFARWRILIGTIAVALCLPRPALTEPITAKDHFPGATDVFQCKFDSAADANQVGWPDRWTRERGAGYPRYLEVRIDAAAPPQSAGQSLRMNLDGGAAAAYSPPIAVQAAFSYVLECQVRTEGLEHDRAYMSVTFYDAQNKVLERQVSSSVGAVTDWSKLQIGPVAPASDATDHAIIGLHLEPSARADLRGSAWFADVWAGRLPRTKLEADRRDHLYVDPQRPTVIYTASGFENRDAAVDFTLTDVDGHELAREQVALQLEPATGSAPLEGQANWKPPLPDVGLYRVQARLHGSADAQRMRELMLISIRDQKTPPRGEFGWSLGPGEKRLTLDELAEFVRHAGIQWLKFPLWDESTDSDRVEQLYSFAERLRNQHIELVGVLADPPAAVRKHYGDKQSLTAAQIFSAEPDAWYPSLEPILTRLTQIVRCWQLGRDDDLSFVNFPSLSAVIGKVRQQMERFGQRVQLGAAWSWMQPLPVEPPAWNFVSLPIEPAGAVDNETVFLERTEQSKTRRWVAIQPLPAEQIGLPERAADLSRRMMTAKIQRADGVFISQLYGSRFGLCHEDGAVGELFLPWRTTAQMLAGADYEGSLRLPNDSSNRVFSRDRQMLMMLWNDKPLDEEASLGEQVELCDLWGRVTKPVVDAQQKQHLKIDRLPIFLTNLNEPLLRWQMAASLAETQWPSVFGVPYDNAVAVTNPFSQSVSGTVRLVAPDRWRVVPREITFKLAAGETRQLPLEITLPFDTVNGPADVRLDFDISAERRYQFSVYRTINIGLDDVTLEVTSRLNEQGELVVEQKLINKTEDPVSFRCSLFIPDRQRMITQVVDQGRGADVQTYRLPRGSELIGKTLWLRADELTGRRTLNDRFQAQR
jgi:hypothetical protein